MKQAGSTRLCVLVFKMILVLKELCTFHIGVKDMKIFCCTVIFLKKYVEVSFLTFCSFDYI